MDAQFDMDDFVRIVVSENQIRNRLDELTAAIRADYEGRNVLLVGVQPQSFEQATIVVGNGIGRGKQLLAVEDGVRAGEETQGLQFIGHVGTSRG